MRFHLDVRTAHLGVLTLLALFCERSSLPEECIALFQEPWR